MGNLEDLGEVISTDMLVVGGSLAGLSAAIKAKEESPEMDVLIVDKQTVGWGGAAPRGGMIIWVCAPGDDPDSILEYHVKNFGLYLNDQELLSAYVNEMYGAVEKLTEWGVKVARDADGKLETYKPLHPLWSCVTTDLDLPLSLRKKARKMGAKILNKVQVVELLKEGDRVVGAVGFNIIDGRFYIFKAKATIIANGCCAYKVRDWPSSCGDGIAAAYRAGAEMRNGEFSHYVFFQAADIGYSFGSIHPIFVGYDKTYDAAGKKLSERYDKPLVVPAEQGLKHAEKGLLINRNFLVDVETEINEGRGPVSVEIDPSSLFMSGFLKQPSHWPRSKWNSLQQRVESKTQKYGISTMPRAEAELSQGGHCSDIKVDHDMKTTVEGLWAIGDASFGGSAWAGATTTPPGEMQGSGLGNALFSGLRAGSSVARFIPEAASPEVNDAEVKRLKEKIFAPMKRDKGLAPRDAISALQGAIMKTKFRLHRTEDSMDEVMSKIEAVQQSYSELFAKDYHGLGKCHEAKSLAVCAAMTFMSASTRTESRGFHIREDYPERDDKNWLKWVIIKEKEGKMVASTEPVPINKYKHKP